MPCMLTSERMRMSLAASSAATRCKASGALCAKSMAKRAERSSRRNCWRKRSATSGSSSTTRISALNLATPRLRLGDRRDLRGPHPEEPFAAGKWPRRMVSGGGLRDGGPRAAPRGEAFESQLGTSNCGSPVGQRALARARQSDHEFREDAGLGRGLNRAPMLLDDDVVAEP